MNIAGAFAGIDLVSPFVTVAVDSNRINVTLQALVHGMNALQKSVDKLDGQASSHATFIQSLQHGLGVQQARTDELEKSVAGLRDLEARMATVERNVEVRFLMVHEQLKGEKQRVDGIDRRLGEMEKKRADQDAKFEALLADTQALAERTRKATDDLQAKLKETNDRVAAVDKAAAAADAKATLIASMFDMDLKAARAVADAASAAIDTDRSTPTGVGPASSFTMTKKGSFTASAGASGVIPVTATATPRTVASDDPQQPLKPTVAFCRALPSFASLEALLRRIAMEEAAAVKALLSEKLDTKTFYRAEAKIDEAMATAKAATAAVERLQVDMESRVQKAAHKADIEKLHNTKADRSELVGMVSHAELRVLSDGMKEQKAFVERTLADYQLEAREARVRDNATAKNGAAVNGAAAATVAELADLLARISELEKKAVHLQQTKADRTELAALQAYIEDVLANIGSSAKRPGSGRRAATPPNLTDPLQSTPRKRLLSPIGRAGSATIPDGTRGPNEPLYYTSLPVRPESPVRSREYVGSSTGIFDSNGHRTSAMLSQSRPASAADHYDNMRRVQAGESTIPSGYEIHEIPMQ
jgi:hypothetical protein